MLVALLAAALLSGANDLPLAARVSAERDMERARYAFVIGATQPFDKVYAASIFEKRVARQMAEEAALGRAFGIKVSTTLLAQEFDRVEKETRAPDQWAAIKKALGYDRLLIEEAFCRALLVHRALLARFAFDQKIHAKPHEEARQARAVFLAQRKPAQATLRVFQRRAEAAPSTEALLDQAKSEAQGPRVLTPPTEAHKDAPIPLDPEVAAVLEKELHKPGDVTTILEERDQFEVFRLITVTDDVWKVEAVRYPKVDFEVWFSQVPHRLKSGVRPFQEIP